MTEAGSEQREPDAAAESHPARDVEDMLDEALEETFPASDPVAAEIPGATPGARRRQPPGHS